MLLFVGIVCGDSWTRIVVVRWAVSAICCMTKLHSIAQIAALHCCAENYFFCMENCFEKLSHTPLEGFWLALLALLWCVVLFSMRSRKKNRKNVHGKRSLCWMLHGLLCFLSHAILLGDFLLNDIFHLNGWMLRAAFLAVFVSFAFVPASLWASRHHLIDIGPDVVVYTFGFLLYGGAAPRASNE